MRPKFSTSSRPKLSVSLLAKPLGGAIAFVCCQQPVWNPTGTYLRTLGMLNRLSTLRVPHPRSQGFCSRVLPGMPSDASLPAKPLGGAIVFVCCQRPIRTPTGTYLRTHGSFNRAITLCTRHPRSQGFCSPVLPGVPSDPSLLAKPFFRVCHVMPAFWPNPWDGQQGLECCQRPISTPTGTYLRTLGMLNRLSTLCTPHPRSQGFCSPVLPSVPSDASHLVKTLGRGNRVCVLSAARLQSHWYISPHPWDAQSCVYALYATSPLPRVLLAGTSVCAM